MKRRAFSWIHGLAAATLAGGAVAAGCQLTDPEVSSSLTLGLARAQPVMDGAGVVVVVQHRGGASLRLSAVGGKLRGGKEADGEAVAALSLPEATLTIGGASPELRAAAERAGETLPLPGAPARQPI